MMFKVVYKWDEQEVYIEADSYREAEQIARDNPPFKNPDDVEIDEEE